MRRGLIGSIVGVALCVLVGAAMLPFRSHLSIASAGLILVLPVVAGVIAGGLLAGIASVIAGFLVYDFWFVPPYNKFTVGSHQGWVSLVVYAVVMVVVARVVANLERARAESERRRIETHRIFELSENLVAEQSVDELLRSIVKAVGSGFNIPGVALLTLHGDHLEIAATYGVELSPEELGQLDPRSGIPVRLSATASGPDELRTVALTAAGRPEGILVTRGMPGSQADRELLRTFANHAALALEQAELREQLVRTELLEEIDRLRHALVGAVSHDLRSPLATMKLASSTLLDPTISLSDEDAHELFRLFEIETDRLARLVDSLLDMTRIDAGALEVRPTRISVARLIEESVAGLRTSLEGRELDIDVPQDIGDIEVDQLLIDQVLANLLENANRHAPAGTVIEITAELREEKVMLSVSDEGPGVPDAEREAVFDRYVRFDTGGRAGLGLTIAKTFVEAHGESIWVERSASGGARFCFTVPRASLAPAGGA